MRLIESVWAGESAADMLARTALAPLEGLFRGAVRARGWLYDIGLLKTEAAAIPTISVGNLTVGGTGKTPVSAWLAARLAAHGRTPAIVLRGYGGDEPLVHSRINPEIPVVIAPNRVEGIREAATLGADVAILDDAFQHRSAARDVDIVLVSADEWTGRARVLPAGPFREPMSALSRASAVFITRKSATDEQVERVNRGVKSAAPGVTIAVLRLDLSGLVRETPPVGRMPAPMIAGKNVLGIAAVGNPSAFFRQLNSLGATLTPMAYPDHHDFTAAEIGEISRKSADFDYVVCTLKDAVKLGPVWPASNPPLWYVSLAVLVESGEAEIDDLLMRLKGRIAVT
ncbi:MAG: tetraacyldisaccharide 4'-kinase [Gemmatimonadales bacterium]